MLCITGVCSMALLGWGMVYLTSSAGTLHSGRACVLPMQDALAVTAKAGCVIKTIPCDLVCMHASGYFSNATDKAVVDAV